MTRFFWGLLCFAFPWVVMLIYDNPGAAVAALLMQATAIGWIPASMWAWRVHKEAQNSIKKSSKKTKEEK